MNVARPGRRLGPIAKDLSPPEFSWTVVVRRVLFDPLMNGDPPLPLKALAQRLLKAAAPPDAPEDEPDALDGKPGAQIDKPGAATEKRLDPLLSGRGEASVQRMARGEMVPSRDVLFDLLRILEQERGTPQRHDLEELWAAYKPALRERRPDLYKVYEVVDAYASALLLVSSQQQEITRLETGLEQHTHRAARADERVRRARRAQAVHRQVLRATGQEMDRLRVREQHVRHDLDDASAEVARMRQDVATARAQVEHWQEQAEWHLREKEELRQDSATQREAWQEREALLLERLAQACENLRTVTEQAAAVEAGLRARETHWRDQAQAGHAAARSARADAEAARSQAAVARAEAEAAREEATRVLQAQQDRADALVAAAGAEQEQAQQTIGRLRDELRRAQAQLRAAQQNATRQDAQLTSLVAERALNADVDDIVSQVLAQHQALGPGEPAWIDAGPEAIHIPSSAGPPPDSSLRGYAPMTAVPAQPTPDAGLSDGLAERRESLAPDPPVKQTIRPGTAPAEGVRTPAPAADSDTAGASPPSEAVSLDAPDGVGPAAARDEPTAPDTSVSSSALSASGRAGPGTPCVQPPRTAEPQAVRSTGERGFVHGALADFATDVAERLPRWLRGTLLASAVSLLAIGCIGAFIGGMYWVIKTWAPLAFHAGDRPKILTPSATGGGTSLGVFQWTLSPSHRQVTASFTAPDAFADDDDFEAVIEQTSATTCPGGTVEWEVRSSGSPVASGVLTGQQPRHRLKKHAAAFPGTVTLTLRRTDNKPCTVPVRWNKPYFYKPSLEW